MHDTARLALRDRMKAESPERLAVLSERARACFVGEALHLRIEALYHRFITQPEAAQQECSMLYSDWVSSGFYEGLSALGLALEELLTAGLPLGIVRRSALYYLARIRYEFQPLTKRYRESGSRGIGGISGHTYSLVRLRCK